MAATGQDAILKRVGDLVKLAQSDNEEEARNAAMQATRLMKEHQLVLVPQSELERVQKVIGDVRALAAKHEADGQQKLIMGTLLGFVVSKQGWL